MVDATQPDDGIERQHTLDGYEEWDAELDQALPWWEALDRGYEREMERRMAVYVDRLREGEGGDECV